MDLSNGNFFTLTLVSGSTTHLDASNIQKGQTINLEVKQPTTATDSYGAITFSPDFKFAGGTAPTVTEASGSTDLMSFLSFDTSTLYGNSLLDFS